MFSKISMLVFVVTAFVFAANVAPSSSQSKQPENVGDVINLHTTTVVSADTFAAAEIQTYGPYEVTPSANAPMYSAFMVQGDIITGTTPTMSFDYQLISGLKITDTLSKWTPVCTLGTAGVQSYVSLSSLIGKAIVFRVNNYDGTESQIPNKLRIFFKDAFTYTKQK